MMNGGDVMKAKNASQRRGERGIALILAIGFLAVLSILGAVVLTVTTRDLGGSATFTPGRNAFYTADRAVEYSMNRDIIINLSPGETVDLMTVEVPSTPGILHHQVIDEAGSGRLVSGTVTDLGPNELPPSVSALFGSDFGANFYHVEVETQAPGAAEAKVNASIVRLFKSDDDTIFRTSGGG
jgi:hypothetical protein